MTVLVTGASGFVGRELCSSLQDLGCNIRPVVRTLNQVRFNDGISYEDDQKVKQDIVEIGDITCKTDWELSLRDVHQVVHLAARVHVMNEKSPDPLAEFFQMNVAATINLAKQAAFAGAKRFIFLSSIKVNGEFTEVGQAFTANDVPAPDDPYGISKYEAEKALRQIAGETGMEVVIIRSPLIYGPGVKANFAAMMQWLRRGIPLPLGAITYNRRSMVALGNLVDLITVCLNHPAAANQTFLVSDEESLSMASLLRRTALALGVKARLFSIPPILIKFAAKLLGREAVYQRLCGSLQIDMTKTQQLLGWKPPLSVDEGLRLAVRGVV
jgi:nucleoside-diphosphate-sugar epimerase